MLEAGGTSTGGTTGKRYALSHATVHMHPAGGGARGYAPDVEIQYKELKRMQDLLRASRLPRA